MEEIITSHNQNEDCLSKMAKRVGSSESKYRLKKVPEYNSISMKQSIKRIKTKSRVTDVVKRYAREFDSKYNHRNKADVQVKSSVVSSDVTSLKSG